MSDGAEARVEMDVVTKDELIDGALDEIADVTGDNALNPIDRLRTILNVAEDALDSLDSLAE